MVEHLTVRTPQLDVDVRAYGAADGAPVLLVHGWPDGPAGWDVVAGKLAGEGYRVVVPALRGFGATRFVEEATPRRGRLIELAEDVAALAEALGWGRFLLAGHDWGARTAYRLAILDPRRVIRLATLAAPWAPAAPEPIVSVSQAQMYWYQWLFNTPMGPRLLAADRHEFIRHIWREWSPTWQPGPGEIESALAASDNPDWIEVTLDYYRNRWDWGGREAADPEAEASRITVPTLTIHGRADGCVAPAALAGMAERFPAGFEARLLDDVGHFPHREAPDAVAQALLRWFAGAQR
ncbi:alpha/beta hydrolase [Nocardia sp. CDC159]|uniref:Alpha/beta hydrolase n=1 Tax=Nocardia pulmonis TaxID=2951408 RepID=A0A9X2EFQ1_9NOCA|nr:MULTISPECIES: alpha/beta hydrolase [Nocardia]MCM6778068.1 alpha/beta hydrolase [Nocardia pulmonis]MCM6790957.1 alpha/beta hydrolase [Nocardia sp. CDC159]